MDETTDPSGANRQIARAAATVMLAIVVGQLLGLLPGILVARAFPAAELDAFFAANRVSETLFMLIAAGALGSAFIPTFTGMLTRRTPRRVAARVCVGESTARHPDHPGRASCRLCSNDRSISACSRILC